MLEGPLERRLHLHLPELGDREIEVLDRCRALVRIVLEEELGEAEASEGDLRPESDLGADFERLVVVAAGFMCSPRNATTSPRSRVMVRSLVR